MLRLVVLAVGTALISAWVTAGIVAYGVVLQDLTLTSWDLLAGIVGYHALLSVVGAGVGMATRRSAFAISLLLGWWLLVESVAPVITGIRSPWLQPFASGLAMTGTSVGVTSGSGDSLVAEGLSVGGGAIVLGVFALGLAALGVVRHRHGDVLGIE